MKATKTQDLIVSVPTHLGGMTGLAYARQNYKNEVTLIYLDGSKQSAQYEEILTENTNIFELVRHVQNNSST